MDAIRQTPPCDRKWVLYSKWFVKTINYISINSDINVIHWCIISLHWFCCSKSMTLRYARGFMLSCHLDKMNKYNVLQILLFRCEVFWNTALWTQQKQNNLLWQPASADDRLPHTPKALIDSFFSNFLNPQNYLLSFNHVTLLQHDIFDKLF